MADRARPTVRAAQSTVARNRPQRARNRGESRDLGLDRAIARGAARCRASGGARPAAIDFVRFLKFGALAWGGPAPQIAMIKRECVEEEGWLDERGFQRQLAVYQVLPGPE